MVLKLISATPSPYARKVRISLIEKGIDFELITEVPWDSTTKTPEHNPLEKLPVLILDDGSAVYESYFILEWIEANYAYPEHIQMYPSKNKAEELFAKQVQVVSDGICDACVLMFFEKQRELPSEEWKARQLRKVKGGVRQLNEWLVRPSDAPGANGTVTKDREFLISDRFSLADIAAGAVLGYLKVRFQDWDWQSEYPKLKAYSENLDKRKSFKATMPVPQTISDKIV